MAKIQQYMESNPLYVDVNQLFELVMEEIAPVRYMMDSNEDYGGPTEPQIRGLAIFMSKNLQYPKQRIPVIQAITGNPLYTSSKMLTIGCMGILIDILTITVKAGDHNEWEPSEWFHDVIPGIAHLLTVNGDLCPRMFFRPGIAGHI